MKKTVTFIVLACMFAFVTIQSMSNKSSMKMPENLKTESRGGQEIAKEQAAPKTEENTQDVANTAPASTTDEATQETQPALRLQMPTSR